VSRRIVGFGGGGIDIHNNTNKKVRTCCKDSLIL
jgi:hypothetical protein